MKRFLGAIGLCARAGRLTGGEESAEKLARSGKALLVLIDEEASQNAKKALRNACEAGSVPMIGVPAGELGRMIGKPGRMAAAVTDPSFAAMIQNSYQMVSGVH